MEQHEIIPDIVDKAPKAYLEVIYPQEKIVNFGQELTPFEARFQPSLCFDGRRDNLHTLVMLDPDSPSRCDRHLGEIRHWHVINIPGSDISCGDVLCEYRGATPGRGSGPHRYVFLVFQQECYLKPKQPKVKMMAIANRAKFCLRTFARKNKLGYPQFGNFFLAQHDWFVEEINKRTKEW